MESSGIVGYSEEGMEICGTEECDIDHSRTNPVVALGDDRPAPRGVVVVDTEL